MKKLKFSLFIGTIIGTLGGIAATIYYIEKNKKDSKGFKFKGIFDMEYLRLFKTYDIKKNAKVTKENIYFNYDVPFKNKSIKKNENKLFNIGSQTELLISLALFKLIEETKNNSGKNKITLEDSISKWFSIGSGPQKDRDVAKILNGDHLKQKNPTQNGWIDFNYLQDIKIYNLLLHTSTLPDFNNLKTEIKNSSNKNITQNIKDNYYKYPIVDSYENGTFNNSRTKWELLDFFNLAASEWIDKEKNHINNSIYKHYFNESRPLNNKTGPLKNTEQDILYTEKDYSALNFILLANILEKVYNESKNTSDKNKKTFDQIVKEYVLVPLKMNKTFYDIKKIDKFKDKIYKKIDTSFLNGSKGYVSTLEDLSKLYKSLFKKDNKLLNSESFNKFFELVYLPKNFKQNDDSKELWNGNAGLKILTNTFDYNFRISKDYKDKIFYIKGISPDFRSYSFYCLKKEIFFIVASDVPYSYYSTTDDKVNATTSELTNLINKTFDFDISLLLDKK